jgi:hypothetical protein
MLFVNGFNTRAAEIVRFLSVSVDKKTHTAAAAYFETEVCG